MGGESFFRIDPADHSLEVLGSYPGATAGFAVLDGNIYFGTGRAFCVGRLPKQ